jgi:hypothetical protein
LLWGTASIGLTALIDSCWRDMMLQVYDGDLLDQDVEVIVNAWNRNIIPWWLLLPQGVSGAIKRRAGYEPLRELARHGPIPLGGAVQTGAGRLPFRAIICTDTNRAHGARSYRCVGGASMEGGGRYNDDFRESVGSCQYPCRGPSRWPGFRQLLWEASESEFFLRIS